MLIIEYSQKKQGACRKSSNRVDNKKIKFMLFDV